MSKVLNVAIALTICSFYMVAFTVNFADTFGGLVQAYMVGLEIFGACFLIVGFYIMTRGGK